MNFFIIEEYQAFKGLLLYNPINLDMYNLPNSSSRLKKLAIITIAISSHPNAFVLASFQPNGITIEGQQLLYGYSTLFSSSFLYKLPPLSPPPTPSNPLFLSPFHPLTPTLMSKFNQLANRVTPSLQPYFLTPPPPSLFLTPSSLIS